MTPDDYKKVKEIFQSVLDAPPEQRTTVLDTRCAGDPSLRPEVERLLHSYESEFLESPAVLDAAPDIAADGLVAGSQIGHYTILKKIGSGGMGEVYLAEDGKLGRQVAIKILPEVFTKDEDRLRRFNQEARTASALNHPNILTIHEIGESNGANYIATEFIDGETLRQKLNRDRLSVSESLDIAIQTASALAAAHDAGIIHRDIKPENIMLRRDNLVKVLDFGLAKLAGTRDVSVSQEAKTEKHVKTAPGVIMGTVQYMSPEQARGHATDARTDIWSLGVVMYEMLVGEPPFKGESSADIIAEIVKTKPPLVSKTIDAVSKALDDILQKSLEKSAYERYLSSNALLADLKGLERKLHLDAQLNKAGKPTLVRKATLRADGVQTEYEQTVFTDESGSAVSSTKQIGTRIKATRLAALGALTFLILIVGAGSYVFYWYFNSVEATTLQIERLSTNGRARTSAISPDGKYVAYAIWEVGGESLWIRHVPTQKSTQIIPPSAVSFESLNFTRDSNHIYYIRSEGGVNGSDVYVIPMMGGTPKKVVENANYYSLSLAPTDDRMVFSRSSQNLKLGEIIIADLDGTNQRTVLKRDSGTWVDFPRWSPDGTRIAFVSGNSAEPEPNARIYELDLKRLTEKEVPGGSYYDVMDLEWTADGTEFLIAAREKEAGHRQILQLSYPDGQLRRLTNDLNSYRAISVTADPERIVAIQEASMSGLWVSEVGAIEPGKQVSFGYGDDGAWGVKWTAKDQIVYTSNHDIWIMNADGSDQRELTLNSGKNLEPCVSGDNRHIVFVSDRTGSFQLWRMGIDGSDPVQLTFNEGGRFPQCSPDGKSVFYQSLTWRKYDEFEEVRLWKMSIEGGEAQPFGPVRAEQAAISPDGKQIAFYGEETIFVMSTEGGEPKRFLDVPEVVFRISTVSTERPFHLRTPYFRWMANGRGLILASPNELKTKSFGHKVPEKIAEFDGDPATWDISRDGKKIAYQKRSYTSDVVSITGW